MYDTRPPGRQKHQCLLAGDPKDGGVQTLGKDLLMLHPKDAPNCRWYRKLVKAQAHGAHHYSQGS